MVDFFKTLDWPTTLISFYSVHLQVGVTRSSQVILYLDFLTRNERCHSYLLALATLRVHTSEWSGAVKSY